MTTRPKVVLDGHYSFAEASEILGKDPKTIYRWRKLGYLPETRPRMAGRKSYILGKHILRAYDALC